MANNEIINVVDIANPSDTRRTVDLLPTYLRTDKNTGFLTSTLDQLIQPAKIERISGFIGSTLSPNYNPATDQYIPASNGLEADYQLEPALLIRDAQQNIKTTVGYDDLINQIAFETGVTSNHNRLFESKTYSYNPYIDWDKFVNFNQYYWLPTGPDAIEITGPVLSTVSTYAVTDDPTKEIFIFTPDGVTPDPLVTLYRGMTYVFNVSSKHKFWIKTAVSPSAQDAYFNASNNGISSGQIILTVDATTPSTLFYVAGDDSTIAGRFIVENLDENSKLDVVNEIVGKVNYQSGNGITLTNGMKIRFSGMITPASYIDKEWIVEGVGTAITLTDWSTLQNAGIATTNLDVNFDGTNFDEYPFDNFSNIPFTPEYITINKSSLDGNAWSRYNRWFHADVIIATAEANNVIPVFPQNQRANRPIVEFKPNLQLFNYGSTEIAPIDLIDNITANAFTEVEGTPGYYVDSELLQPGYRVIFNNDNDPLVRGRVYLVDFVSINGLQVISLVPTEDWIPVTNAGVAVLRGEINAGKNWWFDGSTWHTAQEKTSLNQFPLFDVFDKSGVSFGDTSVYRGTFTGTRIFGYSVGTGAPDSVLGFPLEYLNVNNVGDYLFTNYFQTDTFVIVEGITTGVYNTQQYYLKFNYPTEEYVTTWELSSNINIPIIQFQVLTTATNTIEITALDTPGYISDIKVDVFVNNVKKIFATDYRFLTQGPQYFVFFTSTLNINDRVTFKIYTSTPPNATGYYEIALGATNNPLNSSIEQFTLAEISDHVKSITDNCPTFSGVFPGDSNLRDIGNISNYGTRLISHETPLSFAQMFIGVKEHNLIDAIRKTSDQYHSFKLALIKIITELKGTYAPSAALDLVMATMTNGKNSSFPYAYSDMLPFGSDVSTRTYTVTDYRITRYSISSEFNNNVLSERTVLVYLNGTQLVVGRDYTFDQVVAVVDFSIGLTAGDVIIIKDYTSTVGSYVPPTPTKLGLYPKFIPSIYVDNTYTVPTQVIQGHDGSITVAYGDFRDAILLEFETRVYNNIKVSYNQDFIDINRVLPGAFRNNEYSPFDINTLLVPEFLRWAGFFGIDYQSNTVTDITMPFTFNYRPEGIDTLFKLPVPGYWRGIYKHFYDTDRPHTCPWEMLGFSEEPDWWTSVYGPAPYTSGNLILWNDLATGTIQQGLRAGVDPLYVRPGLLNIIPVDDSGNLRDVTDIGIIAPSTINNILIEQDWVFGDQGPAETAWRRSSLYPFAVQIMLALAKPALYASLMWDTSRLVKNLAGQYRYGSNKTFLQFDSILVPNTLDSDGNRILASGYSVFLVEAKRQGNYTYLDTLQTDLSNINYNLFAKVGGFVSKDKLQIIIDAVDPTSSNPGVLLPSEDYSIYFNKSNPTATYSVSGVIVQKTEIGFTVRGYDKTRPYFPIYNPLPTTADNVVNVGGRSEPYLTWTPGAFYQTGVIASYANIYYRCVLAHTAGGTFTGANWNQLKSLPVIGGVTVYDPRVFESDVTLVPYGTSYATVQEVYNLFVGYGKYLTTQGFTFNEVQPDLNQTLDWKFSGKEFLYWSTQNWVDDSIITVSPFADQLSFNMIGGVVDDLNNAFYEYSVLKADGSPFPPHSLGLQRQDNVFTISTVNTTEGLFFVEFSTIQKEHALVFNNRSLFNDIIYDIESGYRQRRIHVSGFRTANWNGDFFSPGFVYDDAQIQDWAQYTDYGAGSTVRYAGKYYFTNIPLTGTTTFDFTNWDTLPSKPTAKLLPNFDYKINQFEDFYSLNIDNFDAGVQAMAQHLTGYSPRPYLDNIFDDPIAQYKFYQGYIKEKGTKNAIDKLIKASVHNLKGEVTYNETWAFRVGTFGGFETLQEIEITLDETSFGENPQVIQFVDTLPVSPNNLTYYKTPNAVLIKPDNYSSATAFPTTTSTYQVNSIVLPMAGYPRYDDVTATAYNKNSILDIANNKNLQEGDTIWVGFAENGSWDVLRYSVMPSKVVAAGITDPINKLVTFTTDIPHNLNVGDLVSVTRYNEALDQVYIVYQIPTYNQFTVATTLSSIPVPIEIPVGLMFNFVSARLSNFDDVTKFPVLEKAGIGETVWVDDDGTGKWAVFQKANNFTSSSFANNLSLTADQNFGSTISWAPGSNYYIVGAITYQNAATDTDPHPDVGRVFVYNKPSIRSVELDSIVSYGLNDSNTYYDSNIPANFGTSIAYEPIDNLIFVGAPGVSYPFLKIVSGQPTFAGVAGSTQHSIDNTGLVKINTVQIINLVPTPVTVAVLASGNPVNSGLFGTSIAVQQQSSPRVLVGAPGEHNVYVFNVTTGTTTTVTVPATTTLPTTINSITFGAGSKFGNNISGSADLSYVAVGAPGYANDTGAVAIYQYANGEYTGVQVIQAADINNALGYGTPSNPTGPYFTTNHQIGTQVVMSADGSYLAITVPNATSNLIGATGAVVIATLTNGVYVPLQDIRIPNLSDTGDFGSFISMDATADTLVISSSGTILGSRATFDTYTQAKIGGVAYQLDDTSPLRPNPTTFDSNSTKIYSSVNDSGNAFVYNRFNTKFAFGQELIPASSADLPKFGTSTIITDSAIVVGAPGVIDFNGHEGGEIVIFAENDTTVKSWQKLREQTDMIDLTRINRAYTLNDFTEQVKDYLEIIDPVKGKISGEADQELSYKTMFDPAVYSLGVSGVVVNSNINWIDDHVGELWWDLSTVKFVWYEQGNADYRKNNWNGMFPGSTIDVYEWVGTHYLPSQWASLADTPDGLSEGISGQPKFPDNSVVSVKQVYNAITNAFTNVYYYWVKNKTIVPNIPTRQISAYSTAQLIANPSAQGVKYITFQAPDSIALVNLKPDLISDQIHLHVEMDSIGNTVPRHTEWLLIEEGNPTSLPNTMLSRKLIDSLVGTDSVGNQVPDPTLPNRLQYGVTVLPRQSLFVNRLSALANIFEYINSVLAVNLTTGIKNFANISAKEPLPSTSLSLYDQVVEDLYSLNQIDTKYFEQATISSVLVSSNGAIEGLKIGNPGSGYSSSNPPYITINGKGTGAVAQAICNALGEVIGYKIINPGSGYTPGTTASIRPFCVVVLVDTDSLNQWAIYQWNAKLSNWIKIRTQSYDTSQYWKYTNWYDPTYNSLQPVVATVDSTYELDILLSIPEGNYVKVKNSGDGRYLILRRTPPGTTTGTFSPNWDVMVSENGTIQFLSTLWSLKNDPYAFDEITAFDQTEWDQSADEELRNILISVKDDLFINDLAVYWNLTFLKAVKYALSEQKNLDWAFKTAFIGVTNHAGALDQRPTYKLQDSSFYEDYINEVKPYHTKIRNFTVNYTSTDVSSTFIGDYDLPAYWDSLQTRFRTVGFGNSQLTLQPWKTWFQNYSYSVGEIIISDPGSGYTNPPTVTIIPAAGDPGKGATAVAYISKGSISSIEVTNGGSGYSATPTVILQGGGGANTPARVYAQLYNDLVRSTKVEIKFDRISKGREIGLPNFPNDSSVGYTRKYQDVFYGDGVTYHFPLTWVPTPDKAQISLYVNGVFQLVDSYSIEYNVVDTTTYPMAHYKQKLAILVLSTIPAPDVLVKIIYPKHIELYNAFDRMQDYYEPTSGMPGNTGTLLMSGLEYPGVKIDTLPYSFSGGWDTLPYWSTSWDNFQQTTNFATVLNPQSNQSNQLVFLNSELADLENQQAVLASAIQTLNALLPTIPSTIIVNTGLGPEQVSNPEYTSVTTQLSIDQNNLTEVQLKIQSVLGEITARSYGKIEIPIPYTVNSTATITAYLNNTRITNFTILPNSTATTATITLAAGSTGTIFVPLTAFSTTTDNLVTFRDITDDGTVLPSDEYSLDTLLSGADYNPAITLGVNPAEIVVDGDSFISANAAYAPEEMIPGQVQDSIAINVYTQLPESSPLIKTYRYQLDGVTQSFPITRGQNTSSYIVIANNTPLHHGTDYLIDISNQYLGLVTPLAGPGWLSISCIETGGVGLLDKQADVNANPYTNIISSAAYTDIKDVYVTVNGLPVSKATTATIVNITNYGSPITLQLSTSTNSGDGTAVIINDTGLGLLNGASFAKFIDATHVQLFTDNQFTHPIDGTKWAKTYIPNTAIIAINGWMLTPADESSGSDTPRALLSIAKPSISIANPAAINFTQAWFFNEPHKAYSEVYEQIIKNPSGNIFTLEQPPGSAKPYHSQVIVEYNGVRLIPPETVYYIVEEGQTQFSIRQEIQYNRGIIDVAHLEVYRNGDLLQYGIDYVMDQPQGEIFLGNQSSNISTAFVEQQAYRNTLTTDISNVQSELLVISTGTANYTLLTNSLANLNAQLTIVDENIAKIQNAINNQQNFISVTPGVIKTGDALAITVLDSNYDYLIEANQLFLSQTISVPRSSNDTIRIISFTNHDGSHIRKEKFNGNPANTYVIQRPVFDTNYIWVEYNGATLITNIDFTVEPDGVTVKILPKYYQSNNDVIVIMSMSTSAYIGALGYRMFTDILGRTGYKRLSSANSTYLAQPLQLADVYIYVEDGSVLSKPNTQLNLPGVIYIFGERIEYFTISGNILGQLRRGTLGTGAKNAYNAGAKVIDQSANQTINVNESTKIQKFITSGASTYVLSDINLANTTDDIYGRPVPAETDTIEVYYGGRKLLKPTVVTPFVNVSGTVGDGNYLNLDTVKGIVPNTPIAFTGNGFGNLLTTELYYVKAVYTATTQITISQIPNGEAYAVFTATGALVGNLSNVTQHDGNVTFDSSSTNSIGISSDSIVQPEFNIVQGTNNYAQRNTFTKTLTTTTGAITTSSTTITVAPYLSRVGKWKSIILDINSGTTFTLPNDFSAVNIVEIWGGGGSGGDESVGSTGGGGGGYAAIANIPQSANSIVSFVVGKGGDGTLIGTPTVAPAQQYVSATSNDGGTTIFGDTTSTSGAVYVYATGGGGGSSGTPGTGHVGALGSGHSTMTMSGNSNTSYVASLTGYTAVVKFGGGGGAGGPNGPSTSGYGLYGVNGTATTNSFIGTASIAGSIINIGGGSGGDSGLNASYSYGPTGKGGNGALPGGGGGGGIHRTNTNIGGTAQTGAGGNGLIVISYAVLSGSTPGSISVTTSTNITHKELIPAYTGTTIVQTYQDIQIVDRAELRLNIVNGVEPNLALAVFQRQGTQLYQEVPGLSMQEITDSPVIRFLSESPADIPDDSYYGGDLVITLETDGELQAEDGSPLEGE